jgi:transcriptional regulator with XRE-family HTH domain
MPAIERKGDRGRRLAHRLCSEVAEELRLARVGAGLSQAEVAREARLSRAAVGRLERGEVASPGFVEVAAAYAVVGLDLSVRSYPSGDAHRDRGHAQLLERLRVRLPAGVGWRLEVPFPQHGDLRAWDAVIRLESLLVAVEAETRLRDSQEVQRRLNRKRADGRADRLILLVADTRSNRAFLRSVGDAFMESFPIPGPIALRRLEQGLDPGGDAIIRL